MTGTARTSGLITACAALALLGSCRDEAEPTDLFVAGVDEVRSAHCACSASSEGCDDDGVLTACEERVVRRHQNGIASWLECAGRAKHEEAQCVERSGCVTRAVSECVVDPEDRCGPAPEGPTRAIQAAIEAECEEPTECGDEGCEDEPGNGVDGCGGSTDATPCEGPVIAPPVTATPPPVMPPSGMTPVLPPPTSPPSVMPPPDTFGECLASGSGVMGLDPVCLECACRHAPRQTLACDATCWGLITCVGVFCGDFASGTPDQVSCVVERCSEVVSGAAAAMAIAPTIRGVCAMACPPPTTSADGLQ